MSRRLPATTTLATALLVAATLALTPGPAFSESAADAPCIVLVSTEPDDPVTGQQVLYRARILRRQDVSSVKWVKPLAFPDMRSEWLPGRAEDTKVERAGALYLVREEHRALFPARPGRRVLPAFEVRCHLDNGRAVDVPVPAITLEVTPPPLSGRPADWNGAVGPLHLLVLANTREITLGGSVRLSVSIRGGGNLWVIDEPFPGSSVGGAEIFRRPQETDTEAGERLQVRRFFRLDVVPHAAGTLEIPQITLPYYDPASRRYATARSEPLEIQVRRRPAPAPPTLVSRDHANEGLGSSSDTSGGRAEDWNALKMLAAVAMGGAVVALAVVGLAFQRRQHGERRRWEPVMDALRAARVAAEGREVAAEAAHLARALEAALARSMHVDAALLARARALAVSLERIRFSAEGERPDRDAVETLIDSMRSH